MNRQILGQTKSGTKFVFFNRPWEVEAHKFMSKQVRQLFQLNKSAISFLTMFSAVVKEIRKEGYAVNYLPPLLKKTKVGAQERRFCAELEHDIVSNGGVNFTTMLNAERFAPNSGLKKNDFLFKHVLVLNKLIPRNCFLICSDPEHMIYWIAVELVLVKKGAPISFRRMGVPPDHVVPGRRPPNEIWKIPQDIKPAENPYPLEEWKQRFLQGRAKPAYLKFSAQPRPLRRLRRRYRESKHLLSDYLNGSYFADLKGLLPDVAFRLFRKYRKSAFQKYCQFYDVKNSDGIKIYVPLHVEPEGATLVLSHQFTSQVDFVRLISNSTPVDTTILVKENPYMLGLRHPKYYMALNAIPRVVFLDPQMPSNQIIPYVDMVATLSGTSALEGLLMGKSSLIFGDPTWAPFFRELPNFAQGCDLKAFPEKIQELLSSQVSDELTTSCFNQWVQQLISCPFVLELHPERHDIQISPSHEMLKETLTRIEYCQAGQC